MEYQLKKLVQNTKNGSNEAAQELLNSLRPLIVSSIKRYAYPDMDMDELLQEGYLEVLRLTYDYDESKKTPYLGYVKKYLKYFYLNYYRGERVIYDSLNREVSIGDEAVEIIDLIDDKNAGVEDECEGKERSKELYCAINRLTLKQRRIIYQYYFCQKQLKEIAKDMHMYYMSVVKLKKRALLKLETLLRAH
jgi:RNA polymerase sporulation-specific sigma factor